MIADSPGFGVVTAKLRIRTIRLGEAVGHMQTADASKRRSRKGGEELTVGKVGPPEREVLLDLDRLEVTPSS